MSITNTTENFEMLYRRFDTAPCFKWDHIFSYFCQTSVEYVNGRFNCFNPKCFLVNSSHSSLIWPSPRLFYFSFGKHHSAEDYSEPSSTSKYLHFCKNRQNHLRCILLSIASSYFDRSTTFEFFKHQGCFWFSLKEINPCHTRVIINKYKEIPIFIEGNSFHLATNIFVN